MGKRIAILGLYSSGSTAIAGVVHHMGINLGEPLWCHYESTWITNRLREWWHEPDLFSSTPFSVRVHLLTSWITEVERKNPNCIIGAKHPLLILSGLDIMKAWGEQTKFIWSFRPLNESISSLVRRKWWPGKEITMQTKLWHVLMQFLSNRNHLCIDFSSLKQNPESQVQKIIKFLEISPTKDQQTNAVKSIRR
ncbi:MAG: hypothetical protein Q8K86_10710 [Candidatus Nanopelagicaceae bacterium]|nr:hypothetical protein [Candidatus Nanopelagicaceae bacterium]